MHNIEAGTAKRPSRITITGTEVRGISYEGKPVIKPQWHEVKRGVRFQVVEIDGVDGQIADGAIVEQDPGEWTPFQFNKSSGTIFIDCPKSGKQTMVTVDSLGNPYIDTFDPEKDGSSTAVEIGPGYFTATFAHPDNERPIRRFEWEEPGFYHPATELLDIERGATEIKRHPVPPVFWEAIATVENQFK